MVKFNGKSMTDSDFYDYKCIDFDDIYYGDEEGGENDGVSQYCDSDKVINNDFVRGNLEVCPGPDCIVDFQVTELILDVSDTDLLAKEINLTWRQDKNVKIIASYYNGKWWNVFYEQEGLINNEDSFYYHNEIIQINDNVEKIKFECSGEDKEKYICIPQQTMSITYTT